VNQVYDFVRTRKGIVALTFSRMKSMLQKLIHVNLHAQELITKKAIQRCGCCCFVASQAASQIHVASALQFCHVLSSTAYSSSCSFCLPT
jgi:hypothetical protein